MRARAQMVGLGDDNAPLVVMLLVVTPMLLVVTPLPYARLIWMCLLQKRFPTLPRLAQRCGRKECTLSPVACPFV